LGQGFAIGGTGFNDQFALLRTVTMSPSIESGNMR